MQKKYIVRLSDEERGMLQEVVKKLSRGDMECRSIDRVVEARKPVGVSVDGAPRDLIDTLGCEPAFETRVKTTGCQLSARRHTRQRQGQCKHNRSYEPTHRNSPHSVPNRTTHHTIAVIKAPCKRF